MSHTATGRATTPALLTALRVVASLTVLALLWQFVTAGPLVEGSQSADTHATGAIVLHVLSGLTLIVAVLVWRGGAALWPAVLALVVFVLTFVQAYLGSNGPISVHVPGAMVLTVGAVVVAAWSFTGGSVHARR